jgi:pimeloyl-ACP methyl ester carboxylesterase
MAPDRPRTGSLDAEVAWLGSVAAGSWLVGMSGGATLGLALAATSTPLAGAILHEPAIGSLAPELLAPVAAAFRASGVTGLGQTLYGESWTAQLSGDVDDATAAAELEMFRGFEPAPVTGRVVVTYGEGSPEVRRAAAEALRAYGCEIMPVPGAAHFAAHDHPQAFADLVATVVSSGG